MKWPSEHLTWASDSEARWASALAAVVRGSMQQRVSPTCAPSLTCEFKLLPHKLRLIWMAR